MKGNSRINECCFVMLIILRLTVLPHKHPHELLDSVVKERLVKSFVSTEARILQQPHSPSSVFLKISFQLQPLAPSIFFSASRQREANSTAFQTAVNILLNRFRSTRSKHRQDQNTTLPARRILHSFRCFATPLFKLTLCFQKSFPRGLRRKRCEL